MFHILKKNVFLRKLVSIIRLLHWKIKGKPIPPPSIVKQDIVKKVGKLFNLNILVETGTYMGDMVDATKKTFKEIYSVELDDKLYRSAKKRFSRFQHIHILQGDSSKALPGMLSQIPEPCLFWLDSHYSGGVTARAEKETPIEQELEVVSRHPIRNHVILIDDARCFNGTYDYQDIEELKETIKNLFPGSTIEIADDIIRISLGR